MTGLDLMGVEEREVEDENFKIEISGDWIYAFISEETELIR